MYNHYYPVGAVAAGGTIAVTSGLTIAGWVLLGAAVLAATVMTTVRLRRGRH
jgi:hypothetical protein